MRTLLITGLGIILLLTSFIERENGKLKLPDVFAKIPRGTLVLNDSSENIVIPEFYMSRFEVSNQQYRNFLAEVSPGLTARERKTIQCDSTGWNLVSSYGEPMVKNYFRHPAFNEYPVVNVPYAGALKYCEWLQEKIQKENPGFVIKVRLPSREEWTWAAQGGRRQAMYPWGDYRLRNKNGEAMCNFKRVNDHSIYRNRKTGKPEIHEGGAGYTGTEVFTSPVKSFTKNDYGLYNMCGNAAEMISEQGVCVGGSWNDYGGDVHIRATTGYEQPYPTIGFRPIVFSKEKGDSN